MRYYILVLALLPLTVSAEQYDFNLSIASGTDFIHDKGKSYSEIRWRQNLVILEPSDNMWKPDTIGYSIYAGSMSTKGIGIYATWGKFLFGWGPEYADIGEFVPTEHGYELLAEYAFTESWAVSIKHRSNCRDVCRRVPGLDVLKKGPEDEHNQGYNYITLRYTF